MKGSEAVCCLKNSVTLGGRVTICSLLGVFQIDCAPSIADCCSHTAADIQMTNSYYMSDFNKYEKCLLAKFPRTSESHSTVICGSPGNGEHHRIKRAGTGACRLLRASCVLPIREDEYCMMVLQTSEYSPYVAVTCLRHELVCMTILSRSSQASFILTGDTQRLFQL